MNPAEEAAKVVAQQPPAVQLEEQENSDEVKAEAVDGQAGNGPGHFVDFNDVNLDAVELIEAATERTALKAAHADLNTKYQNFLKQEATDLQVEDCFRRMRMAEIRGDTLEADLNLAKAEIQSLQEEKEKYREAAIQSERRRENYDQLMVKYAKCQSLYVELSQKCSCLEDKYGKAVEAFKESVRTGHEKDNKILALDEKLDQKTNEIKTLKKHWNVVVRLIADIARHGSDDLSDDFRERLEKLPIDELLQVAKPNGAIDSDDEDAEAVHRLMNIPATPRRSRSASRGRGGRGRGSAVENIVVDETMHEKMLARKLNRSDAESTPSTQSDPAAKSVMGKKTETVREQQERLKPGMKDRIAEMKKAEHAKENADALINDFMLSDDESVIGQPAANDAPNSPKHEDDVDMQDFDGAGREGQELAANLELDGETKKESEMMPSSDALVTPASHASSSHSRAESPESSPSSSMNMEKKMKGKTTSTGGDEMDLEEVAVAKRRSTPKDFEDMVDCTMDEPSTSSVSVKRKGKTAKEAKTPTKRTTKASKKREESEQQKRCDSEGEKKGEDEGEANDDDDSPMGDARSAVAAPLSPSRPPPTTASIAANAAFSSRLSISMKVEAVPRKDPQKGKAAEAAARLRAAAAAPVVTPRGRGRPRKVPAVEMQPDTQDDAILHPEDTGSTAVAASNQSTAVTPAEAQMQMGEGSDVLDEAPAANAASNAVLPYVEPNLEKGVEKDDSEVASPPPKRARMDENSGLPVDGPVTVDDMAPPTETTEATGSATGEETALKTQPSSASMATKKEEEEREMEEGMEEGGMEEGMEEGGMEDVEDGAALPADAASADTPEGVQAVAHASVGSIGESGEGEDGRLLRGSDDERMNVSTTGEAVVPAALMVAPPKSEQKIEPRPQEEKSSTMDAVESAAIQPSESSDEGMDDVSIGSGDGVSSMESNLMTSLMEVCNGELTVQKTMEIAEMTSKMTMEKMVEGICRVLTELDQADTWPYLESNILKDEENIEQDKVVPRAERNLFKLLRTIGKMDEVKLSGMFDRFIDEYSRSMNTRPSTVDVTRYVRCLFSALNLIHGTPEEKVVLARKIFLEILQKKSSHAVCQSLVYLLSNKKTAPYASEILKTELDDYEFGGRLIAMHMNNEDAEVLNRAVDRLADESCKTLATAAFRTPVNVEMVNGWWKSDMELLVKVHGREGTVLIDSYGRLEFDKMDKEFMIRMAMLVSPQFGMEELDRVELLKELDTSALDEMMRRTPLQSVNTVKSRRTLFGRSSTPHVYFDAGRAKRVCLKIFTALNALASFYGMYSEDQRESLRLHLLSSIEKAQSILTRPLCDVMFTEETPLTKEDCLPQAITAVKNWMESVGELLKTDVMDPRPSSSSAEGSPMKKRARSEAYPSC